MRGRHLAAMLVLAVAVAAVGVSRLRHVADGASDTAVAVEGSLGAALGSAAGTEGYARASAVRSFAFPADHGPHPDFRNEWWYFTGNLQDGTGRRFGYQLTFFRIALAPGAPASSSRWRTNQVYMAHFALTDVAADSHLGFERFGRAAAGVAGAENPPLHLWLDDWVVEAGDEQGFPLRLKAESDGVAIDLLLAPSKPVVLNGDRGLSRKSVTQGNASYYYSLTRLPTTGSLRTAEGRFEVTGSSWLDREWSTSALAEDQAGWDWFALQLDDGRDLMLYRLRRKDGSMDPASAGTLVDNDGETVHLSARDMDLAVRDYWTSPRTGARYPVRWRLKVPREKLSLEVEPLVVDQEMNTRVRYWEGAVSAKGEAAGRPVSGSGYMELAGYGAAER